MALRNILVHVDRTEQSRKRLDAAAALADRHGAHLVGVGVKVDMYLPIYAEVPMPEEVLQRYDEAREKDAAEAKANFDKAVSSAGRADSSEWRIVEGNPTEQLALHARYADLTIIGQPDPDEGVVEFAQLPDNLVMESGRPIIVIPFAGAQKPIGGTVMVAWNGSREAARAVADAMPILEKAAKVEIFSADVNNIGDVPGADIASHLSHHGIKVNVTQSEESSGEIGETILEHAAKCGADLLVMGAYGHSRFREVFLGGATREILRSTTIPVLLAH